MSRSSSPLRRRLFWVRVVTASMFTILGLVVLSLAYVAIRFPAASIPALLVATIAHTRAPSRRKAYATYSAKDRDNVFGYTLYRALAGGALGYGALAALGVGVPDPQVSLIWRLFGGLVFGALAGVAATLMVDTLASLWAVTRRPRAA